MSLTAAVSGSVVFLLFVSVVQAQDDWGVTYPSLQICALKGSTVEIHSTNTYPSSTIHDPNITVEEILWFTKLKDKEPLDLRVDSDYTGRVQYVWDERICTLIIKDLKENDSAEYKFSAKTNQPNGNVTGEPGVTLKVTDLQVNVSGSTTHARLTCHSSCEVSDNPSYIWFRNGKEIYRGSSFRAPVNEDNTYHCALQEHEDYPSPAVYLPKDAYVSLSPSDDIVERESVNLTCSSDANPAAEYTWYKKNSRRQHPLVTIVQPNFTSIKTSDSGEYFCTADNGLGSIASGSVFIDVQYAPQETLASVIPSSEIVEGRSVYLVCSGDANPAASYTWYKETGKRRSKVLPSYFLSIKSSDSGKYYCEAENKLGNKTSRRVIIDVEYAPRLPSVSVSPSAVIVEGSSVILTCSSDANPAAGYTWYKENEDKPKASGQIFNISNFRANNSGNYYCEAHNKRGRHSFNFRLTVASGISTFKINITRLMLLVLVLIPLLLLLLWMSRSWMKKTLSSATEPADPPEMIEVRETEVMKMQKSI
ncbi:B-cell receptor CD22-like [Notolabrus celidotus]|uniref:B-cell receptor CD22-like n=1 Tax=Notolabrus celidotus TaxID=1203425 RepID=UPI0014907054|nr:B-cell receptor CD22-like [Notolabrus celidotus]